MSAYLVNRSHLQGEIVAPASKSHTLRAILFASFAHGKTNIHHYLPSTDTKAMIEACRSFGALIRVFPKRLEVHGIGGKVTSTENVIDARNSGIILRFCAAVGALSKHPVVITGDHSIRHQRPILPLLDGLNQLGVSTSTMRGDGYAPIIIQGPLKSGKAVIDGKDSQPVSALLIAAAFADGPITLSVENPGELPWVALTLNWFDKLGIAYEHQDFKQYRIPGNSHYNGFEYHAPGDFSTAAFPIAAALITQSELTIKNLDIKDSQGDKKLISVLQQMGGKIQIDAEKNILRIQKSGPLTGIDVDINGFVDAITILAVVACYAKGKTRIYNAAIARQKECNRLRCISTELKKMGADINETDDGLIIHQSSLKGCEVESYQDHRMAMSLIVAAFGAENETKISSIECISKTYPKFMHEFKALGANIKAHR